MKSTTITINGMHCESCATLLTEVLEEVPGVSEAAVSYPSKTATVKHSESVSEKQLREAIEAEGYTTK